MKSIHLTKVCLSLLFLSVNFAFSQNDQINEYVDKYTNVVPETPNAAAFVKYGNTPVSYEKGTPNISVPLYTISVDGVSIPISLSYDASGIRVDELSTSVGLKWRLNAGGGIFRTVNNNPDEGGWTTTGGTSYDNSWYVTNPVSLPLTQHKINTQNRDHAPDDFTYNIGGYFGQFFFKRKDINTILKNKNDNLKILPVLDNGLEAFEVKDVNGNTYSLGNSSDSKEYNSTTVLVGANGAGSGSTSFYKSGWLVDEITTKNNKTISFEYLAYEMDYWIYGKSEKVSRAEKCYEGQGWQGAHIPCINACRGDLSGDWNDANYYYTNSITNIRYQPKNKLISKIYTATEEVEFIYVDMNSNAIWDKKLDHIIIKDKIRNITRSFHFVYDFYDEDMGDERLRLDEVYEKGLDNETKPSYKFTYEDTHDLPAKNTMERDYFGYYNGEEDNLSLIPFTGPAYKKLPLIPKDRLANREPSLEYAQTGNLVKIEYPTGGVTKFEYELNQEQNDNGEDKLFKGTISAFSNDSDFLNQNGQRVFQRYFTIPEHTLDVDWPNGGFQNAIRVTSNSDSEYSDGNCDDGLGDTDCIKYYIYEANNQSQLGNLVGDPAGRGLGYDGFMELPIGNYFLVLKVDEAEYNPINNPNGFYAHVDLEWIYRDEDANNEFIKKPHYAGGLRVKEIYDVIEDITQATKYNKTTYTYSGLVGQNPMDDFYINKRPATERTDYSSDFIGPKRFYPSGHFYQSVIITKKDKANNVIKTKNEYESGLGNHSFNGKISKSFKYKSSGLNDYVLDKTFYEYTTNSTTHSYNILGELDQCYSAQIGGDLLGYNIGQNMNFKEYENHLTKKINTQYFYDDQNVVTGKLTNIADYIYNSDELIAIETIDHQHVETQNLDYYDSNNYTLNTDADVLVTKYYYPRSYMGELLFQDFVNNKNLLSLPVHVNIEKNSNLIVGKYLAYDTDGNIKELYSYNKGLGSNTPSFNYIPSNYELDTEFKTFNGKLIEVSKPVGTTKSYIWDTTDTFLLAEIANQDHASISSQITTTLDLANMTDQELRDEFSLLRVNNIKTMMITNYTYKPLFGVSSMTDARGKTIYYEYDKLFRLKYVKDNESNILSETKYIYKN